MKTIFLTRHETLLFWKINLSSSYLPNLATDMLSFFKYFNRAISILVQYTMFYRIFQNCVEIRALIKWFIWKGKYYDKRYLACLHKCIDIFVSFLSPYNRCLSCSSNDANYTTKFTFLPLKVSRQFSKLMRSFLWFTKYCSLMHISLYHM